MKLQSRRIEQVDIELLAGMASQIDAMRINFNEPAWHRDLTRAVNLLHKVAMACEREYGFDIYDHEDEEAAA
jgi:hypothetical protein